MQEIIIIGAGIAGLAAGCYGQMNGYRTRIFEMHSLPGGLCTSWKRGDYVFDGCIHWLVGSGEGSGMNHIWRELGALKWRTIVDHEEFARICGTDREFIVYTDIDRLERHMLDLAPVDARPIKQFCRALRRLAAFARRSGKGGRIASTLGFLPVLPIFVRYGRTSVHDFAGRFQDPFLRDAFARVFDLPDFPLIAMLFTLAWMNNKDAGYPIGGSLAFAEGIAARYRDLGGEIHYKSPVSEILVEPGPAVDQTARDRAVGVRLADGTEHRADLVISAADGHATIFNMLNGKYVDDEIQRPYKEWPIFAPLVQVSLGIDRDLSHEPHMAVYPLDQPITIAGKARRQIGIKHYGYDPTLAPEGKSVVEVMFESDYDYWAALQEDDEDGERYQAEKKDIAIKVIDQLERRYPGITAQIEVTDVATPLTYARYTGNWQGSMEGWLITTDNMRTKMKKTLPGLDRFYMCGQWVEPGGGLPTAAASGRQAIADICQRDGREFVTTTA